MMDARNQRLTTVFVALLVLAVPLTFAFSEEEQVEESDAILPLIPVITMTAGVLVKRLVTSFVSGAVVGTLGTLYWTSNGSFDQSDDQIRNVESQAVYETFRTAIPIYSNSMENYANIWPLTSEHWVRQAELASASYWNGSNSYDSSDILNYSGVYINNAIMMANASEHINEQFESVGKTIKAWGEGDAAEYYGDGKMQIQFALGNNTVSVDSSDTFQAKLGAVVRNVSAGGDCVYYAGGPVWVDGNATMTSTDGYTITLSKGWNYIAEQDDFEYPGIYELDQGRTYFATSFTSIISTADESTAPLSVAFIVTTADDMLLVSYDYAKGTLSDGSSTGNLVLRVIAQGNDYREQSMTELMQMFGELQYSIAGTTSDANTSARTVWGIYDSAGKVSHYLTTLSVPDTYENVTLNEAQKRMMTIVSMDQLAEYWKQNGEKIKSDDYTATLDSLSLYCRGSIKTIGSDGTLETVYDDVIYTPIFYEDTTLKVGTNHQNRMTAFVMIWGEGTSLASFTGEGVDVNDTNIIALEPGCQLGITEIKHDGQIKQTVDLEVSDIEWIDVEDLDHREPYDPEQNDLAQLIRLIFLALGVGVAALGVVRKNLFMCIIGVAMLFVGVLFAGTLAEIIYDFTGWRFRF